MTINIAIWADPNIWGNFAANRNLTNPSLTAITFGWQADRQWIAGHARSGRSWTVILILIVGAIYYAVTQLRRTERDAEADRATGEAVIG